MKINRFFNFIAAVTAAGILSGCGSSLFQPRDRNPIVKDAIGANSVFGDDPTVAIFGTDATRRLAIIKMKTDDSARICAEPSPDAATELTRKLALAVEAQVVEAGQGKMSVNSETLAKLSQIFKRSQGLQLFRDVIYATCQDFANQAATPDQVNDRFNRALDVSAKLIALEIEKTMASPAPSAR